MYHDAMKYAQGCPQCAIVEGTGRKQRPPLHPIPTECPFRIIGVDVMELPMTTKGNKYMVVFQDLFTKWPMAYPTLHQKIERLARLLVEEVIPLFRVPEALLSDRGTNLLLHLMKDLGIKKLNTTVFHPECDGAVERFNRTLKSMLRKQAAIFGTSGTTTSMECFGLTIIPCIVQLERNHLSYCLVSIVAFQQKQLCYHQNQ